MRDRISRQSWDASLLLACACLLVFLMSALFGSIFPLLPSLSEGRSNLFAAFIVSGHPIGGLVGALPMVVVARRYGMHVAAISGAVVFVAGTVLVAAFEGWWLVLGRFGIGLGGTFLWQAAFAWAINVARQSRRGRTIGALWAGAALGGMVGPQLGALAAETTRWVLVVPAALLLLVSLSLELAPRYVFTDPTSFGHVVRAFRTRMGAGAIGLQAVLAFGFLLVSTLAPLVLSDRGLSAAQLGIVFTTAAVLAAVATPFSGRIVDRGRLQSLVVAALGAMAVAALALPLVQSTEVAVLVVLVLLTANSVGNVPTGVLMATVVERERIDQSLNLAIGSLLWSAAALIGSLTAGAFSSEWPAMIALAVLNGAALLAVLHWRPALQTAPARERSTA